MTAATAEITLVVNDTFIQSVSLTRAIGLLSKTTPDGRPKVEIVEVQEGKFIRSASGKVYWPMPKVLRLVRYVKMAYDRMYGPPQVSKKGILNRDNHTCSYCGEPGANTVDHVQPRSKGGKSSWMNLVAACRTCNNLKRNRTPEEAGMKLRVTPYAPKRKILPR